MIEITDKRKCCGCEACANICPKKCIEMLEDEEGFRYPVVNKKECINCGLCKKVCPIINMATKNDILDSLEFYAAYNKSDEILKNSSSGGLFWIFVDYILKNKGIIYGVVQESTYNVKFIRATTKEECFPIRGSKYLQAHVDDIYNQVKEDLENGKYVLFSGTPCQVAALYKTLKKEYEKLYTIDVVCHGVPSNKVFTKYVDWMQKKYKQKVTNIKWRDKIKGWGPNRVTVYFENGTKSTTISRENPFQRGFLDNLYLRPSCYECKYAKLPRIADISLADFWGYEGILKEENENKGISAVIISSKKGREIFEKTKDEINYHPVSKEYLTARSRHSYIYPEENKKRDSFFKDLDKMKYEKLCRKYKLKTPAYKKVLKKIKGMIIK